MGKNVSVQKKKPGMNNVCPVKKNATENTNPAWKKALERNMQINTPDRTEHSCVTLKSSTEVLKYSIMISRVNESHLPTDFCRVLNLLCCM